MTDNTPSKTIAIASDHAGFDMKDALVGVLRDGGYDVVDLGPANGTDSVDYPDFGYAMANALEDGKAERGVLVCGSGIGISISANRHTHVRAALVQDGLSARLSRQHNDANVLCLGGRLIGLETAKDCLNAFLNTPFEGGRHQRRVDKLSNPA